MFGHGWAVVRGTNPKEKQLGYTYEYVYRFR